MPKHFLKSADRTVYVDIYVFIIAIPFKSTRQSRTALPCALLFIGVVTAATTGGGIFFFVRTAATVGTSDTFFAFFLGADNISNRRRDNQHYYYSSNNITHYFVTPTFCLLFLSAYSAASFLSEFLISAVITAAITTIAASPQSAGTAPSVSGAVISVPTVYIK